MVIVKITKFIEQCLPLFAFQLQYCKSVIYSFKYLNLFVVKLYYYFVESYTRVQFCSSSQNIPKCVESYVSFYFKPNLNSALTANENIFLPRYSSLDENFHAWRKRQESIKYYNADARLLLMNRQIGKFIQFDIIETRVVGLVSERAIIFYVKALSQFESKIPNFFNNTWSVSIGQDEIHSARSIEG